MHHLVQRLPEVSTGRLDKNMEFLDVFGSWVQDCYYQIMLVYYVKETYHLTFVGRFE